MLSGFFFEKFVVLVMQVRNEKRFHRQAQEEIRILEHLRKQDPEGAANVVRMLDTFTFRSHICITFELLSMNLYELIKKNKFQVANHSQIMEVNFSKLLDTCR